LALWQSLHYCSANVQNKKTKHLTYTHKYTKYFILKENLSLRIVMLSLHHQEGRFEAPSVKDVISRMIISAILHANSSLACQ